MEWEEFHHTREYIKLKSLALMKHEGKEYATVGVLPENYTEYTINGRRFYSIKSNVFKHLLETFYLVAHTNYPNKFGTDNASDVIEALYNVRPIFDIPRYIEFLRSEQFAYLMESTEAKGPDKILRIDLFRKLDTSAQGSLEFTGGIFHVLKHFSVNGVNLSTGKDIHNIDHPERVIELIIRAFFIENGEFETPKKLISRVDIDERYRLKFVFYFEDNTNVFFIKTIHKERK